MNNTRFATAIHILTILAFESSEVLSSEYIASSININPVLVRKELIILNEAGLVISKKGKNGGVQLAKPSTQIYLSDIFNAIKGGELLGKKHDNLNVSCPIGRQMNEKLNQLFKTTDALIVKELHKKTLAQFVGSFQ